MVSSFNFLYFSVLIQFLILIVPSSFSFHQTEERDFISSSSLQLSLNQKTGSFKILLDNVEWLSSNSVGFHVNQIWFLSPNSSFNNSNHKTIKYLTLVNVTSREMGDDLGSFQYIKIFWKGDSINFITGFKIYEEEPIIIFEQRFPDGGNFTQLGDSLETLDQVISAFPRFQLQGGRISELGYFTFRYFWDLDMIGVGLDQMPGGLYAGVPLVLYDLNTLRSIVLSPLQNFKTGFQSRPDFFQNDLVCGLHGRIRSIPADFSHQTILFAGSGINSLLESWGDLMLQRYGKQRRKPGIDFISSYLGYFTDTGGYYWYNTEPNKNYQTTIVDVLNYHKSIQLPIRYYELDSWWYYKGNNSVGESGGIKLWEPRPDIFPDGMDGIQSILNTPLVTHSKYYSPDNEYKKKFPFMIEEQAAIPLTGDFWNFIMSQAASWGVTTWEQDWLASIFELMVQPSWDVYTANNFHLQLGQAAKLNGLTVQYCMPVVSDIIASLFNPVASYIRLSDDYSTNPQQWKIGRVSIMAWSLGLIAFKDTFWTISNQPNNPYNFTESNPQLNVIVASLSGAGVAIGDGIGMTNRSLVMQTCTEEGILLRTDKPATAIDETFLSSKHSNRPSGEVWSTYSTLFEPAFKTYYVLAANLTNSYTLYPHSLGILIEPYFVYEYGAENQSFASFDQTHPLIIPACPAKDDFAPFHYFIVVPQVKQSDWIVLGETNKFVAISNQRFERINFLDSSSIKLVIKGSLNEKVTISLYNIKKNNFFQVICLFQNSNKKKMILSCNSFFECSCQ